MKQATLLLVDDHPLVRAGIRNALENYHDVNVIGELENGKAVFEFLEHTEPDCLLIDVTMPDFEPIIDIGKIRKMFPDMKILVVSAYDDDIYVQGLLNIGVNGYHLKDQPLSDLRFAIERILAGERWISSRLVDQLVQKKYQAPIELTYRQRTILQLLHKGYDNRNIAQELQLSVKTIENHLTRLYRQLDVHSRLEAMNYVNQHPELLATINSGIEREESSSRKTSAKSKVTSAILVVDDSTRYRQQLIKMLSSINPELLIYEADSIEPAMKIVRQTRLKLALVDVVLGDENGIYCVQKIHAQAPKTRIVLFSAYPDKEFHRQGIEAGAIAFLDKKNLGLTTLRQILEDLQLTEPE